MVYLILIILLGLLFLFLKQKTRLIYLKPTYERIVHYIENFLLIAPIIGLVIFTILFTTVLQGKFLERSSHAFLLFFLWITATSFYTEIIKHYDNKKIILISMAGFIISVAFAILLTPLDRYLLLIYSHLGIYTFVLGIYLMVVFYVGLIINKKR